MKSYRFYRNFAIICGVLFVIDAAVFVVGTIQFLTLNPYDCRCDNLRMIVTAALVFQFYLIYMIIGCYKRWKRCIRYRSYMRKRHSKKNEEYSKFIKNYF